jgi:hypothetical protein
MGLFTSIDWRVQVNNLLPPVLRSESVIDYITALLSGLKTNSDLFSIFEDATLDAARYNGQKIVLQAALNNIFGITSAPYIIVRNNGTASGVGYVFEEASANFSYAYGEAEAFKEYQLYAFESTFVGDDSSFTVKIPIGIYTAELDRQIKAQVTKYKLVGKSFNTITY